MLTRFHRILQHNGQTDRTAISILHISMLMRDKIWPPHSTLIWQLMEAKGANSHQRCGDYVDVKKLISK